MLLLLLTATWSLSQRQSALPRLDFSDMKLDNGLRVIIAPDHSAPVCSVSVTYNVGSRNEQRG